ncbi:MAG: CehA/McbA family metallohydrolase [Lachnospiraceae bacterium]|nr:CehA/McbA family metallohydrolase [Lachnospiraceae bacterium]
MDTAELTFTIGCNAATRQEGTFEVPSGCGRLCLKHDLPDKYTLLTFLMVKDPQGRVRFLKQLGYSEPTILIGQESVDTTIGGVPGEIPAGCWNVSIFLFAEYLKFLESIPDIIFHVSVSERWESINEVVGGEIWVEPGFVYSRYDFSEIYRKGAAWYKGDLHTHTRLSDGKETPQAVSGKANLMGLDYYVPTEHNTLHSGWPLTRTMIVPGVEITTTLGHANLFGIDRMPGTLERFLADKEEGLLRADWKKLLKECAERSWLFSVNHPFLHVWKWLLAELPLAAVDCLEIVNDPTYEADPQADAHAANEKAILLSDLLWEDGWRICAIGGSDSHNRIDERYGDAAEPSIAGDPATWLYMENLSPANLLDALRCCHACVTRHCEIESSICFGARLPEGTQRFPYRILLKGPQGQPDIFYFHNGVFRSCPVTRTEDGSWLAEGEAELLEEGYHWLRFGAREQDGAFLFYGNPVTRGRKEHRFSTFGEIAEEMERQWK